MKSLLLSLSGIILFSCSSPNKGDTLSADSTTTDSAVAVTTVAEKTNWSTPVSGLSGSDTLFNFLARKKIVQGEFGDVSILTDKLIDPGNLMNEKRHLAVLVHSGEGAGYNTKFASLYTVLAVFELQADQVIMIDAVNLGEATSYGIKTGVTEGDSVMLAENEFAARVHYRDAEEGAGDSGYRRESAEVYVLLNNRLVKVFESDIEDFSFASDEQSYYRETTITTTLTVLTEKTNGLFNLQITTSRTGTELEEDQPTKSESGESVNEEKKRDGIYQWNGKAYIWMKEN